MQPLTCPEGDHVLPAYSPDHGDAKACQMVGGKRQTTTSQSERPRLRDHCRPPQTSRTSSILLTGKTSLLGQMPSGLRPWVLGRGHSLLPLHSMPAAYPSLTHEVSRATQLWSICRVLLGTCGLEASHPYNETYREPSKANKIDYYVTIYDKEPTIKKSPTF